MALPTTGHYFPSWVEKDDRMGKQNSIMSLPGLCIATSLVTQRAQCEPWLVLMTWIIWESLYRCCQMSAVGITC